MSQLEKELYYSNYLELKKILNAQSPVSFSQTTNPANDEMLFIITHQAYELWFKQILFELDLVINILAKNKIVDNSPDMELVVHRLKRVTKILTLLIQQIDVLETMTSQDFLEFRDLLAPASGFQSKQFRLIEVKLGLKMVDRHGAQYYKHSEKGGFNEHDLNIINTNETKPTIQGLYGKWLERFPFFDNNYWEDYTRLFKPTNKSEHKFWSDYRQLFLDSLNKMDDSTADQFEERFFRNGAGDLSVDAMRALLFIKLYRHFPLLQLPYAMLQTLSEIDELMSAWRYRHLLMVRRMIGTRAGTGGTTGAHYLSGTLDKHYVFKELNEIDSFVIRKNKLPVLPDMLKKVFGFAVNK